MTLHDAQPAASVGPAHYRIESMATLKKVGHITPSCNTVLEPMTAMLNAPLSGELSHHFTRIAVENISLLDADVGQFTTPRMLAAARSVCDGDMDAIVWNGTSGCWNGPEADAAICDTVARATGVPMSTSTLAQLEVLRRHEVTRFGLAVPYTDEVTERTIETYRAAGFNAVSHANLGIAGGKEMAYVPLPTIRALLRRSDSPDAQCLVVICTGLPAALVVEEMERELGKPIFDSVAVTFHEALRLVGCERRLPGWGALLRGEAAVTGLLAGT